MAPLAEFAPAKVNLHLHVVGRRDDGYHQLDSLVVFAGVGDRLTATSDDRLSLSVTGAFAAGLDNEADNLVLRAARGLAAAAGIEPAGALVLEKNLPVASGIGGGSADAAAALRLLCRLWDVDPGLSAGIAIKLGADVPVCLAGKPAIMSGIGEVLTPIPPLPQAGIVLVNPGVAVSTQAVFGARPAGFSAPLGAGPYAWHDIDALAATLRTARNDLEPPARALAPEIGDVLGTLAATEGCLLARMSGSGATCFALFRTQAAAERVARTIKHQRWWAWGGGLATG